MVELPLEIEGTWEELAERAGEYVGHPMRLIIMPKPGLLETNGAIEVSDAGPAPAPCKKNIEEKLAEIAARIPPEEWAKLPADLAEQHDHYIYGWPKKYATHSSPVSNTAVPPRSGD